MSEKTFMWLSFRDPEKNLSLGVCMVEAANQEEGVEKAWELGINPGGEVAGYLLNEKQAEEEPLMPNKLYSKAEMEKLGYSTGI